MADFSGISQLLLRMLARFEVNLEAEQLPMHDLVKILKRVDASFEEFRSRISTLERAVKSSSSEISDYLEKLRDADAKNQQRTQDIINLLENIHLGILTIRSDGKVHPEYSRFLEDILETKVIADQSAVALMFESSDINSDRKAHMESIIDICLGESLIVFDLNEGSLVRHFSRKDANGLIKALEVDWSPIASSAGLVEKIVVTLRDTTEIQDLRQKAHQNQFKLDILGQIAEVSIKTFQKFSEHMQGYLRTSFELLERQPFEVSPINRHLHTIKGNARVLAFHYIADCIHEAENHIKHAQETQGGESLQEAVRVELQRASAILGEYTEVAEAQFHKNQTHGQDLAAFMLCIKEQMNVWKAGQNSELTCRLIQQALLGFGTETLAECLADLVKGLAKLAKDLQKPVPKLVIDAGPFRFKAEMGRILADIVGHALRNSLDHGIESATQRLLLGKKPEGRIDIKLELTPSALLLKITDDGQGLNLEAIERKAQGLGLLPTAAMSRQDLALLIFSDKISTAKQVSQISGRGVGMDAMRALAKALGAEVRIDLGPTESQVAVPFDLVFALPRSLIVELESPTLQGSLSRVI